MNPFLSTAPYPLGLSAPVSPAVGGIRVSLTPATSLPPGAPPPAQGLPPTPAQPSNITMTIPGANQQPSAPLLLRPSTSLPPGGVPVFLTASTSLPPGAPPLVNGPHPPPLRLTSVVTTNSTEWRISHPSHVSVEDAFIRAAGQSILRIQDLTTVTLLDLPVSIPGFFPFSQNQRAIPGPVHNHNYTRRHFSKDFRNTICALLGSDVFEMHGQKSKPNVTNLPRTGADSSGRRRSTWMYMWLLRNAPDRRPDLSLTEFEKDPRKRQMLSDESCPGPLLCLQRRKQLLLV